MTRTSAWVAAVLLSSAGVFSAQAADISIVEPAPAPEVFAPALATVSGYGSLWGGMKFIKNESGGEDGCPGSCDNVFDGDEPWIFGGDAQINVNWTSLFSTQFDVLGEGGHGWTDAEDEDDDAGHAAGTIGVHASIRDHQSYIAGLFAALNSSSQIGVDETPVNGMIGGEAAVFLGNFTLYGQAGYFDAIAFDDDNSTLGDMWFLRGVARYFLTPNTRIQGEVAYGAGSDRQDEDEPDDFDLWMWGAELAHRFDNSPLSLFAAYEGAMLSEDEDDGGDSDELTQHVVKVGLRIHFGTGSMVEGNVSGATLDLPDFSQPVAYYPEFDEFKEPF